MNTAFVLTCRQQNVVNYYVYMLIYGPGNTASEFLTFSSKTKQRRRVWNGLDISFTGSSKITDWWEWKITTCRFHNAHRSSVSGTYMLVDRVEARIKTPKVEIVCF